jgi:hypothetical protein
VNKSLHFRTSLLKGFLVLARWTNYNLASLPEQDQSSHSCFLWSFAPVAIEGEAFLMGMEEAENHHL